MSNVAKIPPAPTRAVAIDLNDPVAVYLDADIFGQLQRVAKLMSGASLVPAHLRGEGKLPDCFLVAAQAFRWRMDPFSVAQHTFVTQGKLGYEGKLIAAIINSSGKLDGSLSYSYEGTGDARKVIVSGKLKSDGEIRTIDGTVKQWRTNNAKWSEMPDQMLAYRGAREWARRHMPEAVLGIHGDDESEPTTVTMRDVTPREDTPAAAVTAALNNLPEPDDAAHNTPTVVADDASPPPPEASAGAQSAERASPPTSKLDPDMKPADWLTAVREAIDDCETHDELAALDAEHRLIAKHHGGGIDRSYQLAVKQAFARLS